MPSWCEATWGKRFSGSSRSQARAFVGGVTLPVALADLGLIDEYAFVVQPVLAGHGPTLLAGLRERIQLELVDRHEFRSGAVVLRYRPTQVTA
jgi:dihydrofolate reductase